MAIDPELIKIGLENGWKILEYSFKGHPSRLTQEQSLIKISTTVCSVKPGPRSATNADVSTRPIIPSVFVRPL